MADKSKTIKETTDKELDALIFRLEKESRLQDIIRRLIQNSKPVSADPYPDSYQPITVSTETPIESMYHVGIPGMKWGRRKAEGHRPPSSPDHTPGPTHTPEPVHASAHTPGSESKPASTVHEDHKTVHENMKKPLHELSTADLQKLTKRMELEKKYNDLHPSDIQKGMKKLEKLMSAGNKVNEVYKFSQTVAGQEVVKRGAPHSKTIAKLLKTAP